MIETAADVTAAALDAMRRTTDPRQREILVSLVEHLHGWIHDVGLTEPELRAAASLVNDIGQITSETHNEAVLMAGSLGVSALVCLLNHGDGGPTSHNQLGPFWRLGSPVEPNGASIVRSPTPGPAMLAALRIVDSQSRPIEGARVDVWHSSPIGLYENQDDQQANMNLRGTFHTDRDGRVWFRSVKPAGYPIPTDGVVGRLLAAQGRHPYRPAHLHALVEAEGFQVLVTQIYDRQDPHLDTDPQFGVTSQLIGDYVAHEEPHPDHPDLMATWYSLEHTLSLEPGEARLPQPPIP